jgi:hypothetical protein
MKVQFKRFLSTSIVSIAVAAPSAFCMVMIPGSALAEETKEAQKPMGEKAEGVSESALVGTQKAFFDAVDKMTLSFGFGEGKNLITETEKGSIRALVGAQDMTNERAYIAAWGDRALNKKSSAADRRNSEMLAEKRIRAVEEGLKATGFKGKVVLINMATKPSAIADALGIESEAVKSAATATTDETTVRHQKIANTLESKGGLKKAALVLVELN